MNRPPASRPTATGRWGATGLPASARLLFSLRMRINLSATSIGFAARKQ